VRKIYFIEVERVLNEYLFNEIHERSKKYKYTSMNYIDFDDCKNATIICNDDKLILLHDKTKSPSMLYFAVNTFNDLLKILVDIPGKLRLHFVPKEYALSLSKLGFSEWGEYVDFWNDNLATMAIHITNIDNCNYLVEHECEYVAALSQKCKLQSRGFEGETAEWFANWLRENKVIVLRAHTVIVGFCCVSIYNEGTTLWIREIAVDPEHQGMGLGKKLMEQAIRYGVECGATKGFLAADILNKNAIGLYNKYNYFAKGSDSELQMIKE